MTKTNKDLSPAFQQRIDLLRDYVRSETPYKMYLERALDGLQAEFTTVSDLMNVLLESQRLIAVHLCGLEHDPDIQKIYQSSDLRSFYQFKSPPVEAELAHRLADKVYNMEPEKNDYGMIQTSDGVRHILSEIVEKMMEHGYPFDVQFRDLVFKNTLMNKTDDDGLKHWAEYTKGTWEPVTKRMGIVAGLPATDPPDVDEAREKVFQKIMEPVHDRIINGEIHWTITRVPTRQDAAIDGIEYEDYLRLFFEMCDQPWAEIDKAHRYLINALNKGKELRFINDDGTNLHMNIDGFTFANSVIARNVPGSEVFSAPHKDSVNGIVVSKGHFIPPGKQNEVVEDITLEFKDGKCIYAKARVGNDILKEIINTDDGSCFVGEIGIGTNPYLKRRVANILLAEKISGSFHIALGWSYTQTDYMGEPVRLDNGNRSLIHWDITTMLYGNNGKMLLDGYVISENGLFTHPTLEVLNKGWEYIPEKNRPAYWRNYDFANRPGLPHK